MFFREFIRKPTMIGAIAPSSPRLGRRILERVDFSAAKVIVEYGPGTGVFTKLIVPLLQGQTQYFALELNGGMHEALARLYPDVNIYHDSATSVRDYLEKHEAKNADVIISGLPWAIFNEALQDEILDATSEALAVGGHFATFAYLQGWALPKGIRFRRKLARHFSRVEISPIVWLNMPPAFVYWCTK